MLSVLKMIDGDGPSQAAQAEIFEMYAVVTKQFDDFRYDGDVRNFQFLKKDQAFAHENGQPLTVLQDSYLLIPMKPDATKVHEEVCYLGRKLPRREATPPAGRAS